VTDTVQILDEAAFFQNRSGLIVSYELKRYIGFRNRSICDVTALHCRRLRLDTKKYNIFCELGREQCELLLANAVYLSQIAIMIEAQKNGEDGELLTNGQGNIFPVRGLNSLLYMVDVWWSDAYYRWSVGCSPFGDGCEWLSYRVYCN
jgi:hypothetical protein